MFTTTRQDEMMAAEERLDLFVNSLNSMRDGSSNPAKIQHKIKQVKSEIQFIRKEFPESEYCNLAKIVFGPDVAEHFGLEEFL